MEKLEPTLQKRVSGLTEVYVQFLTVLFACSVFIFNSCSPEETALPAEEPLALDLKASVHFETWQDQIDWLTQKTTRFHNFRVALAQGWDVDATGYMAFMGHHYINMEYADGLFELGNPEMLIYVPDGEGGMEFVGVEYLVFVPDPLVPGTPPEGFIGDEDEWIFNTDVGAWTLHAWVGLSNDDGVFAPLNYKLPEFPEGAN